MSISPLIQMEETKRKLIVIFTYNLLIFNYILDDILVKII